MLCGLTLGLATQGAAPSEKLQGTTYRSPGGTTLRLMLDDSNVGPEATLGEMVFPPNMDSGDHQHGAIEMFYVVSGELEHVVNGASQFLKPGMGDSVANMRSLGNSCFNVSTTLLMSESPKLTPRKPPCVLLIE